MANPPVLSIPSRNDIVARYLRDYSLRNLGADTQPGTQPYIDACVFADQMVGVYKLASDAASAVLVRRTFGPRLDAMANEEGKPRSAAVGSVGFVTVTTSKGGGRIFAGDELRETNTRLRFRVLREGVYVTGDVVPIAGIDVGIATNFAAGTVLSFTSPRPGISPKASVVAEADGSGLTGGAPQESDIDLQNRILAQRAFRPASGNDADYQAATLKTPGVPVERAFTYPAIFGPGTTAVAFTVRSSTVHGGRIPTLAQIAAVESHLRTVMPASDMFVVANVLSQPMALSFRVIWSSPAVGWVDQTPWPAYQPSVVQQAFPAAVLVSAQGASGAPTATQFQLRTSNDFYTYAESPKAGQTIAFYVPGEARFAPKRIAAVAGTGPWDITVDASFGASDTGFVPVPGQRAMPYAPGLTAAVGPVIAYTSKMGPGEMTESPVEPGLRQSRQPPSPKTFPSVVDNRILTGLVTLPELTDAVALEGLGLTTSVLPGGHSVRLLTLTDVSFFP